MAKLTKKQETQYTILVGLIHELIRVKHNNNRQQYENCIDRIRNAVKGEGDD